MDPGTCGFLRRCGGSVGSVLRPSTQGQRLLGGRRSDSSSAVSARAYAGGVGHPPCCLLDGLCWGQGDVANQWQALLEGLHSRPPALWGTVRMILESKSGERCCSSFIAQRRVEAFSKHFYCLATFLLIRKMTFLGFLNTTEIEIYFCTLHTSSHTHS